MKPWQKSLLLITFVAFLGASNGAAIKWGAKDIPGVGFASGRMAIAFIGLLPIIISKRIWRLKQKSKLFGFSLFATGNVLFFIIGIKLTSISISAALYTAVPLLTVLLSRLVYQEKITPQKLLGIVIGLIGTCIVILTPVLTKSGIGTGSLYGNLLIVIGVLFFSLHTTFSKLIQKSFSSTNLTVGFATTACIVLLPLTIWQVEADNWLSGITGDGILALLYSGLVGTIGFYFMFQYAVRHTSPLITSLSMYLQPIFAVILGVLIFDDKITGSFIVGTMLSFIGVRIVTMTQKKPEIIAEAKETW